MHFKPYLVAALFFLSGCNARPLSQAVEKHQLTQISIINALMLGEYDGAVNMQELLRYGTFGLGTLDHLDGELIILDGRAYQAKADGTVAELAPQTTTPFAVITHFEKVGDFSCSSPGNLDELESRLDAVLPNRDLFFAVRVDAEMQSITFRSVPRQDLPYAPLAEVAEGQIIRTHTETKGTLVGFRSPKWSTGLTVPGYHWHFLSADHQLGGHVIDCQLRTAVVLYDQCDSWLVKLNDTLGSSGKDLSANLSRQLEQVESLRGVEQRKAEP
jgi:acetolactate decarboxylase